MNKSAKRIAVIGQGIIGLCCAHRLLAAGFAVDIFSRDDFWHTASTSAGAYWWPHRTYPEDRVMKWSKESYEVFKKDNDKPESGVIFAEHLRFCLDPDDTAYVRYLVDEWKQVDGKDYGLDCAETYLLRLPVIDVPVYMQNLRQEVEAMGGQTHIKEVQDFSDFFPAYDLLINCSGVGARKLANDPEVFPIRGQVVRVTSSPQICRSTRIYQKQDEFTLVLPRTNDIILGGTAQDNDSSLEIREQDTRDILRRCRKIVPALEDCEVLGSAVGLRPGRKEVRLELETLDGDRALIHNYGHSGGGFTVAWGCANEVNDLVQEYFNQ